MAPAKRRGPHVPLRAQIGGGDGVKGTTGGSGVRPAPFLFSGEQLVAFFADEEAGGSRYDAG